jgi:hypothetical protein
MFLSLKRLFGRTNQPDSPAQAYVEGKANAEQSQRVREASKASPRQADDVESLRATVSLLRSVEPVKAPRSFALREEPVPVVYRRPWFTQAPAMAAATAVLAVGVLVASDLAGALRQSGQSSQGPTQEISSFRATSAGSEAGQPGNPGDPGSPSPAGPEGLAQKSFIQDTPPDAAGTASPAPEQIGVAPVGTPSPDGTAVALAIPEATPEAGDAYAIAATAAPEASQALEFATTSGDAKSTTADEWRPVKQPGGAALPLWQMEAALAAFAVLMLGIWAYLKRKPA